MQEFKINERKAKEFGEYIRGIRENLGYSTNKVEIDTGISKSDLSRIENGLRKNINPFYLDIEINSFIKKYNALFLYLEYDLFVKIIL